jgi:hypothetical protein
MIILMKETMYAYSFLEKKCSRVKQECILNTSLTLCAIIKIELYTGELMMVYVALE